MKLPDKTLQIEGRAINVTKWEEIGGYVTDEDCADTAIYTDRKGNFYVVNMTGKSLEYCIKHLGLREVFYPRDVQLVDSVAGHKVSARRVTENAALAWYVWEFMGDTPLSRLFNECIRWHVPKVERAGKAQLRAWVAKSAAAELSRAAKANGITPPQQLELLLDDGLRREKARRAGKPHGKRGKGIIAAFTVQLELATALVEVVGKFNEAPSVETLAESRRAVSALHQAIHAPENFKLAANS